MPVRLAQDHFGWPSVDAENMLLNRVDKFNGLLLLGDSWNIVAFDGFSRLGAQPLIRRKRPYSFKGCNDYFGVFQEVYEVVLILADGLVLSLLICSPNKLTLTGSDTNRLARFCYDGIKAAISHLKEYSTTRTDMAFRLDDEIVVHSEDWNEIGRHLQKEVKKKVDQLVHGSSLYFVAKAYGQDQPITQKNEFGFSNINIQNCKLVVVHCAHDYSITGYILWWKIDEVLQSTGGLKKVSTANAGALKGIGNVRIRFSQDEQVTGAEFHSRIFTEVEKDELMFFGSNDITQIASKLYSSLIQRVKPVKVPKLTRKELALVDGSFCRMLSHCIRYGGTTTSARLETAVMLKPDQISGLTSANSAIYCALSASKHLVNAGRFGKIENELHAMPAEVFKARNSVILETILNTMQPILDGVRELRNSNILDCSTCNFSLSKQELYNLYACNAVLIYYFRGYLREGFTNITKYKLGLVEEELSDYPCSSAWPFPRIRIWQGKIRAPEFSKSEIKNISPCLWSQNTTHIAVIRQTYLKAVGSCGEGSKVDQQTLDQLAVSVVDYMIGLSRHCSWLTVQGGSDLHILWKYNSRRTRRLVTSAQMMRMLYTSNFEFDCTQACTIDTRYTLLVYLITQFEKRFCTSVPFHQVCAAVLDNKMITQGVPLKFLFNKCREYWVMPVNDMNNFAEADITKVGMLRCWKAAFYSYTSVHWFSRGPQFCSNVTQFFNFAVSWIMQLSSEYRKSVCPHYILQLAERLATSDVPSVLNHENLLLQLFEIILQKSAESWISMAEQPKFRVPEQRKRRLSDTKYTFKRHKANTD